MDKVHRDLKELKVRRLLPKEQQVQQGEQVPQDLEERQEVSQVLEVP